MDIPKTIKVGGIIYTVEEKPFVEIDQDRNYQGACLYQKTQIEILDSLSEDRKEQTLIHEVTHAIFYEAGFEEQDEDMINRVAIVLHQVLKDNNLNETTDSEIESNGYKPPSFSHPMCKHTTMPFAQSAIDKSKTMAEEALKTAIGFDVAMMRVEQTIGALTGEKPGCSYMDEVKEIIKKHYRTHGYTLAESSEIISGVLRDQFAMGVTGKEALGVARMFAE